MSSFPLPVIEDVSAVIGSLSQNDQIVRLTRQYKGITLAQEARIVEVTPDTATLQATRSQRFPLMEGDIHLHSQAFPRPVAARVRHINFEQGLLLLSDLAYADWKKRQTERVQPQKPTYANLTYRRHTYRALIEDISIDGLGLLANRAIDPNDRLQVGGKVSLKFQYTPEIAFSNLNGMLVYRQKVGLQLVKFGIHLYPDANEKQILEAIISQRREEILQELDQLYSQPREAQRIENLYF